MIDPAAFQIVKQEVFRHSFKDDKVKAIAYVQGCFSSEQVAELLTAFNFDDDKMKGLQACIGKMLPVMCVATLPILRQFRFSKNQVSAVELLAGHISDPMNYIVFNEVFTFISDRNKVKEIMSMRAAMGGSAQRPGVVIQPSQGNPYPYGTPNYSVNPIDPICRVVDRTAQFVAGEVGSILGRRQAYGGTVLSQPTATTVVSPPGARFVVHPQPGQTVVATSGVAVTPTYPLGTHPPATAYGYQYPPGYPGVSYPPPTYK